jgi:hypothetical protein
MANIPEGVAAGYAVTDMHLRHHPAEVLGVVREVVQIGAVEIEDTAHRI